LDRPDAELVRQCLEGDHGAWESIVLEYHQRMYNLAYRYTGRFDEAEDLSQEIFLKVYRTLGSYRPESGALSTWLIRVGRNHIIDHYRKFKTERAKTAISEVREGGVSGRGSGREKVGEGDEFEVRLISSDR